ncbi:MAG: NAD(P)-dependent oxidoreductase [Gemmatimonadetes bacterium]|nr:MAG: NAD(P)-dependent oxidoreductase [Gemmatimonadota bacterium]
MVDGPRTSGTILVTGASGMLGSEVVRTAAAQGCTVIGTHHETPVMIGGHETVRMPLEDATALEAVVKRFAPDVVIHCAALTNVDYCEANPDHAFAVNAVASAVLARTASRSGARYLYVSTDAVFDGTRGWYEETDECRPVNVYAASKLRGEEGSLTEHAAAVVVRLAPFGRSARTGKRSLAEWVLAELEAGGTISGFVDAIFTPMYAGDLARRFLELTQTRARAGVYHLGSRDAVSKYQFACALASAAKRPTDDVRAMSILDHPFRAKRPLNVSLLTSKAARDMGWKMPSVREGIEQFLRVAPGA